MTPKQRDLARRALGLDNPIARGRSYRNRYIALIGSDAWREWVDMAQNGEAGEDILAIGGVSQWFSLTRKGANAATNPGESLDAKDFPS